MDNLNKWTKGKVYRQRLAKAEERTSWVLRDTLEAIGMVATIAFILACAWILIVAYSPQ